MANPRYLASSHKRSLANCICGVTLVGIAFDYRALVNADVMVWFVTL